MLSYDERRRLGHIETWLRIDDPNFAEGIRAGLPRAPREYRRWPAVALLTLGMLALFVAALFGNLVAAVPGTAAMVAGTRVWMSRGLDGPAPRRRRY
ncbi:MAG: DUF3040 domain-containing protein [Dactylosporangium sp.]|jgi:hypothetical protein|nr:DUF3040 domain-containing protein [Dactylosporangium sp.]